MISDAMALTSRRGGQDVEAVEDKNSEFGRFRN
jgi:hypothetical protein